MTKQGLVIVCDAVSRYFEASRLEISRAFNLALYRSRESCLQDREAIMYFSFLANVKLKPLDVREATNSTSSSDQASSFQVADTMVGFALL